MWVIPAYPTSILYLKWAIKTLTPETKPCWICVILAPVVPLLHFKEEQRTHWVHFIEIYLLISPERGSYVLYISYLAQMWW